MTSFEHYRQEIQYLQAVLSSQNWPRGRVVFYGGSSIRLWPKIHQDFPFLPLLQLGFGGATLAACSHFFQDLIRPLAPRALICYAGENDLGDGASPAAVLDSFRRLSQQVQTLAQPCPVLWLSVKPSPARWRLHHRILRTNLMLRQECQQQGFHYLNLFDLMLDSSGQLQPELYADDQLHLSASGYRLWRQAILAELPLLLH